MIRSHETPPYGRAFTEYVNAELVRSRTPDHAISYIAPFLSHEGLCDPGLTILDFPTLPDNSMGVWRGAIDTPDGIKQIICINRSRHMDTNGGIDHLSKGETIAHEIAHTAFAISNGLHLTTLTPHEYRQFQSDPHRFMMSHPRAPDEKLETLLKAVVAEGVCEATRMAFLEYVQKHASPRLAQRALQRQKEDMKRVAALSDVNQASYADIQAQRYGYGLMIMHRLYKDHLKPTLTNPRPPAFLDAATNIRLSSISGDHDDVELVRQIIHDPSPLIPYRRPLQALWGRIFRS